MFCSGYEIQTMCLVNVRGKPSSLLNQYRMIRRFENGMTKNEFVEESDNIE